MDGSFTCMAVRAIRRSAAALFSLFAVLHGRTASDLTAVDVRGSEEAGDGDVHSAAGVWEAGPRVRMP